MNRKLTEQQENEVRAIGNDPAFTNQELAAHYQVPVSAIRRVRNPSRKDVGRAIASIFEGA